MQKVHEAQDFALNIIIQEHQDLASGKLPGGKPDDFVSVLLDTPGVNGEPQYKNLANQYKNLHMHGILNNPPSRICWQGQTQQPYNDEMVSSVLRSSPLLHETPACKLFPFNSVNPGFEVQYIGYHKS